MLRPDDDDDDESPKTEVSFMKGNGLLNTEVSDILTCSLLLPPLFLIGWLLLEPPPPPLSNDGGGGDLLPPPITCVLVLVPNTDVIGGNGRSNTDFKYLLLSSARFLSLFSHISEW
jgi:hypothetical protein